MVDYALITTAGIIYSGCRLTEIVIQLYPAFVDDGLVYLFNLLVFFL